MEGWNSASTAFAFELLLNLWNTGLEFEVKVDHRFGYVVSSDPNLSGFALCFFGLKKEDAMLALFSSIHTINFLPKDLPRKRVNFICEPFYFISKNLTITLQKSCTRVKNKASVSGSRLFSQKL